MAAKFTAKILPFDKFERIEDMSNSLNHTKPKTYGTSSDDNNKSHFFNSQRCILHRVEMSDTLIGLAIKYNVTVRFILDYLIFISCLMHSCKSNLFSLGLNS